MIWLLFLVGCAASGPRENIIEDIAAVKDVQVEIALLKKNVVNYTDLWRERIMAFGQSPLLLLAAWLLAKYYGYARGHARRKKLKI